ncbi:MAG: PSD1 and planctomycete cytochrome C domain-containing protein [Prosthecobacter sp.]|uniref:PSD1 and planctomycete cytochrome C domain-containing protein n=1 Tax=Prosthecobacter sp. TaxID=1965333 RepID=UPI0039026170
MTHAFFLVLLSSLAAAALARATEPLAAAEALAFFENKVRPVLAEKCYSCHSAAAQAQGKLKAELFVDSREGLLSGGESGPAIVVGKPQDSVLMKVLRHEIKDAEMPPKGKLEASVIADFAQWIALGAADPRIATAPLTKLKRVIDVAQGKQWWAFKPMLQPPVPGVKNTAWLRTPVDAFILAKQEAAGLAANHLASQEKLLRRACFDLTGLAPTPEERAAFLNDHSPQAYARLIDRLLDSQRYGERWGRHWLDVVRFAESGGYEFDGFRPGAFHYRDWVIKAINNDMPYDAFVRMQLAGDKLTPDSYEGAAAAGFLVAGPYPGQITVKTVEKIRYDQLDDMVSTIGSGLLGLTMSCVRCHDHKLDPLPQRDYYGIAAALATTTHASVKLDLARAETQRKQAQHEQAAAPLRAALKQFESAEFTQRFTTWQQRDLPKLSSNTTWQTFDARKVSAQSAVLDADTDGHVLYHSNKVKDDLYTVKTITFQKGVRAFRLAALSDAKSPAKGPGLSENGNFVLGDLKIIARPLDANNKTKPITLKLKPVQVSFEQKGYPLASVVDNNPSSGWAIAPQMGRDHAAMFAIEGAVAGFEGGTEFEFQLRFSGFFGLGKMSLAFSNSVQEAKLDDQQDMQHLREIQTLSAGHETPLTDTTRSLLLPWFGRFDPRAKQVVDALALHERKRIEPSLTEVYSTKDGGQDVYHLRRGEVDRKEGKASPNFIQVLMRSGEVSAPAQMKWRADPVAKKPEAHPRIALANWMTDPHDGGGTLLARVIVNRLWRQHFGRGIVPTTNDFGTQGMKPTHPELLDYLAAELIRNGWHLKPIQRLIMLSAVYMQSGDVNASNVQRDPDNNLWSQRPARRLEAEAIRDELLQVGGKLDEKLYGPSEASHESRRRSVYLRVKRSELIPFMTMFDAPEPTLSIGDRSGTTVPTQALASMNSTFVRELAGRLQQRIQATAPASVDLAISKAYELALCRLPTPAETLRMKAFIDQQTQLLGNKPDSAAQAMREFCLALLCLNEFIYID